MKLSPTRWRRQARSRRNTDKARDGRARPARGLRNKDAGETGTDPPTTQDTVSVLLQPESINDRLDIDERLCPEGQEWPSRTSLSPRALKLDRRAYFRERGGRRRAQNGPSSGTPIFFRPPRQLGARGRPPGYVQGGEGRSGSRAFRSGSRICSRQGCGRTPRVQRSSGNLCRLMKIHH